MSLRTLAFVGQCHTVGYDSVPPEMSFPEVCKRVIQSARPATNVVARLEPYHHPSELIDAVRVALVHRPQVVVIEVVGWLAVAGTRALDLSRLPSRVRSRYERVKHFRQVAHGITSTIPQGADLIYRTPAGANAAAGLLRPLLRRHPRPTIEEYETSVDAAVALVAAHRSVHAVVQGPGAPNMALLSHAKLADMVERYRAVNEMARRVAQKRRALYVDRWDTVASGFYTDGSVRPTAGAHGVWGHLLAAELLTHNMV